MTKRALSLFLAVMMALSVIPVFAEGETVYVDTDFSGEVPAKVDVAGIKSAINADSAGYRIESGVAGRDENDKSMVVEVNVPDGQADGNRDDGFNIGVGQTDKNLTTEFSVLFDGEYDYGTIVIRFQRTGGEVFKEFVNFYEDGRISALNGSSYVQIGTYKKGEWTRIAINWNVNGSYKLYINDLLAAHGYGIGNKSGNVTSWGWFRVGTYSAENTTGVTKTAKMAVDDLKVYDGDYRPTVYDQRMRFTTAPDYTMVKHNSTLDIPMNATLADLKKGLTITNGTMRVYTDGTFAAQITDDAALIPAGARVVAQAVNNKRIDTFTVTNNSAALIIGNIDFEEATTAVSFIEAKNAAAEVKAGGNGKNDNAYVAEALNVANDADAAANFSILDSEAYKNSFGASGSSGGVGLMASEKSKMTLEYSMLVEGDFNMARLLGRSYCLNNTNGTNEQSGLLSYFSVAQDGTISYRNENNVETTSTIKLETGKWNRIAVEVDADQISLSVRVNGQIAVPFTRLGAGFTSRDTYLFKGFSWLRPQLIINTDENAAAARNAKLAIDDVEIYYGAYRDEAEDKAEIVSTSYSKKNDVIFIDSDTETVSSFIMASDFGDATPAIYSDSSAWVPLGSGDCMSDGNVIVLESESGKVYKYYTVEKDGIETYVDVTAGSIITGPCTISAQYNGPKDGVLILAIYKDGVLCGFEKQSEDEPLSHTVTDSTGITAKAFLWRDLITCIPLLGAEEFSNSSN